MSVGKMLCQIGHVGSVGLCGFKTSFTHGLCGVRGLTVGSVSEKSNYCFFDPCVCFINSHGQLARLTSETTVNLLLTASKLASKQMFGTPTMPGGSDSGARNSIHTHKLMGCWERKQSTEQPSTCGETWL